jgi:hypothetical protein
MSSGQVIDKYAFDLLLNSKQFLQGITQATKSVSAFKLVAVSAAFVTGAAVFAKSLINQYTNISRSVGRLSEYTGESMQNLQAWQIAIRDSGGDMKNFDATISMLNDDMANIANFGEGKTWGMFARLGIGIYKANGELKEGTELLGELGSTMANLSMPDREKVNYMRAMGIDNDTIHLLLDSGKNIDKLTKGLQEKALATQQDYENVKKYDKAVSGLRQEWLKFIFTAAPPMTKFLNENMPKITAGITNFINKNGKELEAFFKGLIELTEEMLPMFKSLVGTWQALRKFADKPSQKFGEFIYDIVHSKKLEAVGGFGVSGVRGVLNDAMPGDANESKRKAIDESFVKTNTVIMDTINPMNLIKGLSNSISKTVSVQNININAQSNDVVGIANEVPKAINRIDSLRDN